MEEKSEKKVRRYQIQSSLEIAQNSNVVHAKDIISTTHHTQQNNNKQTHNCDPFVSFPEFAMDNIPRPIKENKKTS